MKLPITESEFNKCDDTMKFIFTKDFLNILSKIGGKFPEKEYDAIEKNVELKIMEYFKTVSKEIITAKQLCLLMFYHALRTGDNYNLLKESGVIKKKEVK